MLRTYQTFPKDFPCNVSVNSKPDHPPSPGDPRGFARFHCPGGWVFNRTFFARNRGFESKKFCTVLKEKCRNFSICFKETGGSLESRCSCAVSCQFVQKQWTSTVSLITYTIFDHFDKIFRSSKVTFANARWLLTSQGLSLTFGLFQGYSLGYSWFIPSLENHRKSWFEVFSSYYLSKSYFGTGLSWISCVSVIDEWRMIWDIFNIRKSHLPRSFSLLYVSLF